MKVSKDVKSVSSSGSSSPSYDNAWETESHEQSVVLSSSSSGSH